MKKTWKRLCTGFLALATVVTALPTIPVYACLLYTSEKEAYEIYSEDGTFYVEGPLIDYLVYITNFEDYDSLKYFQKVLIDKGVIEELKQKGVKEGQSIVIGEMEFEFFE